MIFFDSHAHLSSPDVLPSIEGVLARAKIAKVDKILNICTDPETLKEGLLLEKRHLGIRNAGATTPHDVEKEGEEAFSHFQVAAHKRELVAIGETGLDYYYEHSNKEKQKEFLKRYLHLALECKLPVIFHCRDAFEDLFRITEKEYQKGAAAILHCFTGTIEEAKEVIRRRWYLSLSGIVTFKKSETLREVAKIVPLSQLLIETDTPYLAPQTRRGRPNEPAYLSETAACIAKVRNISIEELALATEQNGFHLFGF